MKKTFNFGMLITLILVVALIGCVGSSSDPTPVVVYSNGTLDTAGFNHSGTYPGMAITDDDFANGGITHESKINAVAIQTNGMIVAAGYSYNNGHQLCTVARYKADGTLDDDFNNGGTIGLVIGNNCEAKAVAIQTDGKIVIAGYSGDGSGNNSFALARFNADGTLDTDFPFGSTSFPDGDGTNDQALAVAIQSDGKIVVGGHSFDGGKTRMAIARYNSNGSLDTAGFGTSGFFTWYSTPPGAAIVYALMIQPADQKIIAVGYSQPTAMVSAAVLRLTTAGTLDSTFDAGGTTPGVVYAIVASTPATSTYAYSGALQSDGKIVIAGQYWDWTKESGSGANDFFVARITAAGILDTTFNPGGGTPGTVATAIGSHEDEALALAIQPTDQKIVLAGYSVSASTRNFALARYNPNGALDTTFGTGGKLTTPVGTGEESEAHAVAIQGDGKIVAAGYTYESATPSWDFAVVRYGF